MRVQECRRKMYFFASFIFIVMTQWVNALNTYIRDVQAKTVVQMLSRMMKKLQCAFFHSTFVIVENDYDDDNVSWHELEELRLLRLSNSCLVSEIKIFMRKLSKKILLQLFLLSQFVNIQKIIKNCRIASKTKVLSLSSFPISLMVFYLSVFHQCTHTLCTPLISQFLNRYHFEVDGNDYYTQIAITPQVSNSFSLNFIVTILKRFILDTRDAPCA